MYESGVQSDLTFSDRGGDTDIVPSASDCSSSVDAEAEEATLAVWRAEVETPKPAGFVIVRSDKGRMRRLHHIGSCYRIPDEHYFDYPVHGDVLPAPSVVDARCKQYFGEAPPPAKPVALPDVPSEVSSAGESNFFSETGSSNSKPRCPTPPARSPSGCLADGFD